MKKSFLVAAMVALWLQTSAASDDAAKQSVTLLRSFGTSFPWRTQAGTPISHPLLIYAELLHEGEPKALEAAAHIRRKYFAK
jgi:hypothetical protein